MTEVQPHKTRSRRLRKKLHLGEFQEFGFQLTFCSSLHFYVSIRRQTVF